MPANFSPFVDGNPRPESNPKPILTRERLAELERILDRRLARQRAEREPDVAVRLLALLDAEGVR